MSFFARKIPAWAIVLSVLATAGLFTLAFMTLPSFSDAVQANRDFSDATAPSALTVEQGSTVSSTVNMTSLNSYNLAIALTTALSPATSMLTVMLTPSVVTPTANVRASSTMTVVAQPGTAIGSYRLLSQPRVEQSPTPRPSLSSLWLFQTSRLPRRRHRSQYSKTQLTPQHLP